MGITDRLFYVALDRTWRNLCTIGFFARNIDCMAEYESMNLIFIKLSFGNELKMKILSYYEMKMMSNETYVSNPVCKSTRYELLLHPNFEIEIIL